MRKPNLLILASILALVSLTSCGTDEASKPVSPPVDSIPVSQRAEKYEEVTGAFGPLIVREGRFDAEAERRPWSSWWYPDRQDYLYQENRETGELAPLQKYDSYVKAVHGRQSRAAETERANRQDDDEGLSWAGHCNAWAMASIAAPEPRTPLSIGRLTFGVGDLKALLVKSFEYADPEDYSFFGLRYNGNNKSVYEDIYPDQFHRFLQIVLFRDRQPFVMDSDAGIEVWNMPVFAAQISIRADREDRHVMHVEAWLTGADYRVAHDFLGTKYLSKPYSYDLYGIPEADGSFRVLYGEWTKGSAYDHPDFLIAMGSKVDHRSLNEELQTSIVDEILQKAARPGLALFSQPAETRPELPLGPGATFWWLAE